MLNSGMFTSDTSEWTPCSDDNPKADGRYLITGKMGTVYSLNFEDGRWYGGIKPVAWMPLPEPYMRGDPMNDLISRQAAIDVVKGIDSGFVKYIEELPSAEPDERMLHESCTDCPLYDKYRHSCPRFNKVIPETLRGILQLCGKETG